MWSPDDNFASNRNGIDFIQQIYATKLSNVQHDLHSCHDPACLVQTYFPSDMMMWMDKINDRIEYHSMGDSYYRNILVFMHDILYRKWTSYFIFWNSHSCNINVKAVNTLM